MKAMKKIPLTQGKFALVDDEDYKWLSKYKWCFLNNRGGYASRNNYHDKKSHVQSMARFIMNAKKGQIVDHINGDTLDNRRSNLRICTNRQNLLNRKIRSDNTSGFIGVFWNKQKNKWQVRIKDKQDYYHVGYYEKPEHGALVYDWAASILFGEYARLNFPNNTGRAAASLVAA